jgi:hypothetical protein
LLNKKKKRNNQIEKSQKKLFEETIKNKFDLKNLDLVLA